MPNALIWGASGGIGRALVTTLKDMNWQVFGVARHDELIPDNADMALHFDADDPFSFDKAIMTVAQTVESVDLVVYAAGGIRANTLEKLDLEDWNAVISANLTGAFLAATKSLQLLDKNGHLMLISAHVENIIFPRMGAYAAAKAGLETMFTILQKENRKRKLSIVRPPAVDTAFWENAPVKLPDSAIQSDVVAQAILTHYETGDAGELTL